MCIKKGWWDIGIIQIRVVLGAVVTTIAESSIVHNSSGVSSVFYYTGAKGVLNSIGEENN